MSLQSILFYLFDLFENTAILPDFGWKVDLIFVIDNQENIFFWLDPDGNYNLLAKVFVVCFPKAKEIMLGIPCLLQK